MVCQLIVVWTNNQIVVRVVWRAGRQLVQTFLWCTSHNPCLCIPCIPFVLRPKSVCNTCLMQLGAPINCRVPSHMPSSDPMQVSMHLKEKVRKV